MKNHVGLIKFVSFFSVFFFFGTLLVAIMTSLGQEFPQNLKSMSEVKDRNWPPGLFSLCGDIVFVAFSFFLFFF